MIFFIFALCKKLRILYGMMTMKCRFRWENN